MPSAKRAQAARRLRKRLEARRAENDKAAGQIGNSLWWLAGVVVVISSLVLAANVIAGLWRWFVDTLSAIPLWMLIMAVMAAAYLCRAAKAGTLRRKIRKLRKMEKDDTAEKGDIQ